MFFQKSPSHEKQVSDLPLELLPEELHKWPEKDYTAYIWFWTVVGLACLIFFIISIRIWLNTRQHERGCPCTKCKPTVRNRRLQNVNSDYNRGNTTHLSAGPLRLPAINEETDVLHPTLPFPSHSSTIVNNFRPVVFDYGDTTESSQKHLETAYPPRRYSLPTNLKIFYNRLIGFEGFYPRIEKKSPATPTKSTA